MSQQRYPSLFARLLANSCESDVYFFEGTPCWEFQGPKVRGYGRLTIRVPGKKNPQGFAVHRVMAELVLGRTICPVEETVEHRCEIPWCINYWHFALCSNRDNAADMRARITKGQRKLFKPLVDPALYYCDPFERSLPQLRAHNVEEIPF